MASKKPGSAGKHYKTRATSGGYFIFRAWKVDPKSGERLLPPPGKRAWKIWVPFDDGSSGGDRKKSQRSGK